MSAYNLYLLDDTRDPKVITRLSRVTGLAESLVRREARRPPFLVLKEYGLSQAVAVRREFEQMGLTLRLELVEHPTGDRSHPLAGEQAPPDGVEIVLEEGKGFVDVDRPAAAAQAQDVPEGKRRPKGSPLPWKMISLGALALMALLAAWWLGRDAGSSGGALADARALVEREVPQLLEELDLVLRQPAATGGVEDLLRRAERLEARLRPVWQDLPRGDQVAVEEVLARRQTLLLRQDTTAGKGASAAWTPEDLLTPVWSGAGAEAFWKKAEEEWNRRSLPMSLGAQLSLERMEEELRAISRSRDTAARARLAALEAQDPGGRDRLGALRLAGSIQQKGVVWTGEGAARQGWADLPDSTVLEVESAGVVVDRAVVENGRLVFPAGAPAVTDMSLRLAALERQPGPVRRLLEAGLRLMEPEIYFGTLPGSRRARLDPGAAAAQWRQEGDPALKAELRRLGLVGDDTRLPVLAMAGDGPGRAPHVGDWLRAAAEPYRKARRWPQRLELRTPAGRFHISGCELWLLTRES